MELWRQLIEKTDQSLAGCISLNRVGISRQTGEMSISLYAARVLKREEYRSIEKSLAAAFPMVPVKVTVSYPALREAVEEDVNCVSGLLSELVGHESPASMPFLQWSPNCWKLKDGVLSVNVESGEGAAFLKARGVDALLERLLNELFGIKVRASIQVHGNEEERLQQIAAQRLREAEAMAAALEIESRSATAKSGKASPEAILGKAIGEPSVRMSEVSETSGRITVTGEVTAFEIRDTKNSQTKIVTFSLTDFTGSVNCKVFLGGKRSQEDPQSVASQVEAVSAALKEGNWVTVRGGYRYDDFKREMVLMVQDMTAAEKPVREDTAPEKRVELHMHTQMSTMDACASPTDLIKQAAKWGHRAVAITDHGVLQAFPEAFGAAKKAGIKLIPGCEAYMIEDAASIIENAGEQDFSGPFVVVDVETTGLNPLADEIIEIGAVRIENGREVAEFSTLIDPGRELPARIVEITGITSAMLAGQPRLMDVLPDFRKFCEGAVLVAHNAPFDMAFFRRAFQQAGMPFGYPMLDTLALSRNNYPQFKSYKLGNICKQLGISLVNAHRAVHDARATSIMLLRTLEDVREHKGIDRLYQLNTAYSTDTAAQCYHIVLLAASQKGLENLNRLVSEGHLHYFHRTPRIPRSLIKKYREGLIVGSACESGELFRAVVEGRDQKTLESIAKFYDYLEIQPIGNNAFLMREGTVKDEEGLRDLNRQIVALGDRLGIPVAATGDVHFKEPTDAIYRAILMATKGFEDADCQPPLYFRTTDDMLKEFAYLGEKDAKRVVVDVPNAIADKVGEIKLFIPHPEGKETFQPFWPEAESELRRLTMERAVSIYGDPLPEIVQKRIDKELGAIIGYGFSTLYMIAVKLVTKSLSDGYIVGSRGSVGSSFVAFLSGITEVNSLPPHYVCPKCHHCEFDVPEQYTCGLDLPLKDCPECGAPMGKDGFNIPFEVFLGFKGNKVPDIDLNFSGVYQPVAHNYVKELFGKENVFRAGTIGTIADKTAYGYVLRYAEERGLSYTNAEKERLARGITGVKRTTGQHPAGMVVLPKEYSIYQFTAVQHPADDMTTETITTHFDFSSMHDVLVKLDILGHDDPTMLRRLQDLTGIKPQEVPLNDPAVFKQIISLFTSPEALGVKAEDLGVDTGTLGVPEFGTRFVRGMLAETRPSTMEELIRISGLSHGTDVWLGNIQDVVRSGVPLRDCICTRDDIMNGLMAFGVESETAFKTMESVRKGKGLQPFMEEAIRNSGAPGWYVDSCKKIGYMFPKAHAVAYVTMALRIAYFKVFYPVEYYCCYLMRNAESFDGTRMIANDVMVYRSMQEEIDALEKEERSRKDDEYAMLEILIEMTLRGVKLRRVDLYESRAGEFIIDSEKRILPPINSLPGVGLSAAEAFVQARAEGPFISQDDMVRRKVAKSTIEMLRQAGCLNGLPETSQVSLFEMGF